MDHYQAPQSAFHIPFQRRAAQFFRMFRLRTRVRMGKKKPDKSSSNSVMTAVDDYRPRPHSVDIIRKATSPIIGYRLEDTSNPTDTDDSSQDVPSCDPAITHPREFRRHSTYDHLSRSAPAHPSSIATNAQLFVGDQTISESAPCEHSSGPKHPNSSTAAIQARSADDAGTGLQSLGSGPSQRAAGFGHVPCHDTAQMPPALQDTASSDCTITTTATESLPSTGALLKAVSADTSGSQPEPTAEKAESLQQRREVGPPLTMSLSAPFRVVTERGAKLSPSVITRQPLPILNLPPLPEPTPTISTSSRPRVRLRSVPSLTVDGRGQTDHETSHDSASLGGSEGDESDEDDFEMISPVDVHQSDDEEEEESFRAGPSTHIDENFAVGGSVAGQPCSPVIPDYFGSKLYSSPTSPSPSTPPPFTSNTPFAEGMNLSNAQNYGSTGPSGITSSSSEPRLGLHRVASRSMVDLGGVNRHDRRRVRISAAPSISSDAEEASESDQTEALIGRLLRRNSMPNYYHPASDPPPYPSFDFRSRGSPESTDVISVLVQPREDVGRERLPPYSNSLYLTAVMPRKMEFSAPGVQSKDRKWRRVLCELEGTVFRVYKCPPGVNGIGILGGWWEKRVGAGDAAVSGAANHHQRPAVQTSEERRKSMKLGIVRPETPTSAVGEPSGLRQRTESQSSRGTEVNAMSSRAARRASGASFLSSLRSVATGASGSRSLSQESSASRLTPPDSARQVELLPVDSHDGHSAESSVSHGVHNDRSSTPVPATHQPRSASRLSFLPSGRSHRVASSSTVEVPNPSKRDLIRAYTLQHAESGLGNDYAKRKNVIRVRLEGEQFLLQAPDVPSVVEWIEGLHAGTNIALDLDHRTMPRGPMFPRRRRRRNRRMRTEESQQSSASAEAVAAMRMA